MLQKPHLQPLISKTEQVLKEMDRFKLDILGISECRWTGQGRKKLDNGHTILFSGKEERQNTANSP